MVATLSIPARIGSRMFAFSIDMMYSCVKKRRTPMKDILAPIILIIVLSFAVYANSTGGEFIWDDHYLIEFNKHIRDSSNLSSIFTKNIGAGSGIKYHFYRPIQMVTYMVDYSLVKLNVRGYHLTNILLHALMSLCLYWLINILFKDRLLSLFTAAIFAVHPIHTETVSYISGRADILAAVFLLLTLILYIKHLRSERIYIYLFMLMSYILALLSKEIALILPLALLLYHYTFKERLRLNSFLSISGAALIYIVLRFTLLKPLLLHESSTTVLAQRIPGIFAAIISYIRLIFLPLDLHMEYGKRLFNYTDPIVILGALVTLALLIFASRKRSSSTLIFFSISWFFVLLIPQSNLYPINIYMAEHWVYLPSIGLFLILAKGLSSVYRAKPLRIYAIAAAVFLLTFYSILTIRQNNYWRNEIGFYKRTLRYAPDNAKIYFNLGSAHVLKGEIDEAITSFTKAVEINPNFTSAYNNLGQSYRKIGRIDEAIRMYKKAIETDPNHAGAYYNLGIVYRGLGRDEESRAFFKKAHELGYNP